MDERAKLTADSGLLDNLRLAASCGSRPSDLLIVALTHLDAANVDEALDGLLELRALLNEAADTPAPPRALAPPPAGPRLARMRPELDDHELRGRLLFAQLAGRKTAMQVLALELAGLELSRADARLLEDVFSILQVADPGIWPLAVTRALGAAERPLHDRVVGGLASMHSLYFGPLAARRAHELLDEVDAVMGEGTSIGDWVDGAVAAGQRIPGFGRPILSGDERIPALLKACGRAGRDEGASVTLSLALADELRLRRELAPNAALVLAAILRDLGFGPAATEAFCIHALFACVLMHATVSAA